MVSCFGFEPVALDFKAQYVGPTTQALTLDIESDDKFGTQDTSSVPKDSSELGTETENAILDASAADEASDRHP